MNEVIQISWSEANQKFLLASLKLIQEELETYYHSRVEHDHGKNNNHKDKDRLQKLLADLDEARMRMSSPSTLDQLVSAFNLSDFERKTLLLSVGVELDASFSKIISSLNGAANNVYPSFSLALAAFKDAHWSAISPQGPLRYWHLVELNDKGLITKSSLKIDEQILHYITGVQYLNEKLNNLLYPVLDQHFLVPSQIELADKIIFTYTQSIKFSKIPVIQLDGTNHGDKKALAAYISMRLDSSLYTLSTESIPVNVYESKELIRLWNREAVLKSFAIFIDCNNLKQNDKSKVEAATHFIDRLEGLIIINSDEWFPPVSRQKIKLEIPKPTMTEQKNLWMDNLKEITRRQENDFSNIVTQFNLSTQTIHAISRAISTQYIDEKKTNDKTQSINKLIWQACCEHTRPKIDELIQRIEPVADWDDIVLPDDQKQTLKEIALQVRQRSKVYEEWGFAKMGSRGLGISALFSGESGTGKTMASEVLANELELDLYKIDLSQVVNKYIGETEKNLKRIFDAAEEGGAILLFDEADALFGKRSDVKDSHDRYSNIEVSYLLQRMEAYRGLAILTTNMKSSIDKAFFRRIRFVVQFSFPDQYHRGEIWSRAFPKNTPVKDLDIEKLCKLNLPGGNIRNIAVNAAFLAAAENQAVQMHHILKATKSEYMKLEKSLSSFEIKGWL